MQLREEVERTEKEVLEERRRTGARIVGRRGVLKQSWRDSPTTKTEHRKLRPRFASRDAELRIAALVEYRAFLEAYSEARRHWLHGVRCVFPIGTYKLRAILAVSIAALN
jgi:hypothetical protein